MADHEERRLGELTVRIDRLICVGFGDCVQGAPSPFELDEEGIATFTPAADSVEPTPLLEACRACPVDAITVVGPDGEELVP